MLSPKISHLSPKYTESVEKLNKIIKGSIPDESFPKFFCI